MKSRNVKLGFGIGSLLIPCIAMIVAFNMGRSHEAANQARHNHLVDRVAIIADTNNDGVTSPEEWAKVYRETGVYFDYLHPRELSDKQLGSYLDAHVDRIIEREAKYGANLT
ncbi:MAG: hypothetical protein WC796_05045 [Candidatus Pacearchaeota archaeon]|jgi:hypothetical protein